MPLEAVTPEIRTALRAKLAEKGRREGQESRHRCRPAALGTPVYSAWKEWEVPFDADPDWHPGVERGIDGLPRRRGGQRWTK